MVQARLVNMGTQVQKFFKPALDRLPSFKLDSRVKQVALAILIGGMAVYALACAARYLMNRVTVSSSSENQKFLLENMKEETALEGHEADDDQPTQPRSTDEETREKVGNDQPTHPRPSDVEIGEID